MAIVGSAEVLIKPTFTEFQKKVKEEVGEAGASAGTTGGKSLGEKLATWGKRGAVVAGTAIAAVTGTALVKGFGRLTAIENAQAKLRGLGHSAESVRLIMDNALASVKGTAFGLGDAATAAAGLVAAGIKPGQELERTLRLVGDAATIAGVDFNEMGAIFNKVAADGRIQGDVLNQLADRGIPILQLLGEEMGVSASEVRKLAADGKISFATFQNAIERGMGGAALKSGETFTGAMANVGAALSRVGANFLQSAFSQMPGVFQSVIDVLGPLEDKATQVGERLGEWLGRGITAVQTFIGEWQKGEGLGGQVAEWMGKIVTATSNLVTWLDNNRWAIVTLIGAYGALRITMAAHQASIAASKVGGYVNLLGSWAKNISIVRSATAAWTAVQWALNAAMNANIFVKIATLILLVGTALVTAYKNSETFRNIVDGVFAAVGRAATWLWENAIKPVVDAIKTGWDWLASGISFAWNNILKPAWDAVAAAAKWLWGVLGPIFSFIWNAWTTVGKFIWDVWSNVIKLAWDLLVFAAKWMWNNVLRPIFSNISSAWNLMAAAMKLAWDRVLKPAWDAVSAAATWLWNTALKPIFDRIKVGWELMVNAIRDVWNRTLKPVFDAVGNFVKEQLVRRFQEGIDAIKRAWETLKEGFAAPINWVIRNVWNRGIKRAFDSVAQAIGSSARLPDISEIRVQARATGGPFKPGWLLVGENGPELMRVSGSGYVYNNEQTERMIKQGRPRGPVADKQLDGGFWDEVGRIVSSVGRGALDIGRQAIDWVRGGLANAANLILNPVKNLIRDTVGTWGKMGNLVGDTVINAINKMTAWIRGHDEEYEKEQQAGGLTGTPVGGRIPFAQPYVDEGARRLAGSAGDPRMRMYARTRSMVGDHKWGGAVDFHGTHAGMQKVADLAARNAAAMGIRVVLFNRRMWLSGGWRAQPRSYGGGDPWHVRHTHVGWHRRERGGPVRPGQTYLVGERGAELLRVGYGGYIHNNRDLRGLLRDNRSSGPTVFELYDVDGTLIGTMRGEAKRVLDAEVDRASRDMRRRGGVG